MEKELVVAHRGGLHMAGRGSGGSCFMPENVVSGGRACSRMDSDVVRELTSELQKKPQGIFRHLVQEPSHIHVSEPTRPD